MAFNYNKKQEEHRPPTRITGNIDEYKEGVAIVLNLLGSPDAFISDMSRISDWENGEDVLEALSLSDMGADSLIWKVAQRITEE